MSFISSSFPRLKHNGRQIVNKLPLRRYVFPLNAGSKRGMASSSTPTADFGIKHVNKGVGRIADGVMVQAEGSYVRFGDGRRVLDFTCGIGVTNLGWYITCAII